VTGPKRIESHNPGEILEWMGRGFVALRSKGVRVSWQFYRDSLMWYQADLAPDTITLENLIERAMKIEAFIKEFRETDKQELTAQQILQGTSDLLTLDTRPGKGHSESEGS
jgi:hypothetical protein